MNKEYDWIVIGQGISGLVFANQAQQKGQSVLVIEKSNFLGGLAKSSIREGYQIHDFGPHIFHTDNEDVKQFVKPLQDWVEIKHEVKALVDGGLYSLPVSNLTAKELGMRGGAQANINDLEHIFMRGYTEKQWGVPFDKVPKETLGRFRIHDNEETNYFQQEWTAIPKEGYAEFFENLAKNVKVLFNINGIEYIKDNVPSETKIYYTGRIDDFFNNRFGRLEFRSTGFEEEIIENYNHNHFIVNYPEVDMPHTRVANYDALYRQMNNLPFTYDKKAILVKERPNSGNLSLYPVRTNKNLELYQKYVDFSPNKNIYFAGRAGKFAYMDMDDCVLASLQDSKALINNL